MLSPTGVNKGRKKSSSAAKTRIYGTGEMAELIRTRDWSQTALGPIENWSETLLATINVLLLSPFSFSLYWGETKTLIYNDAYRPFLGDKHPASLGGHGPTIWQEVWSVIGPPIERAFQSGEVTYETESLIPILIDGQLQNRWWTYGFYPVYESGKIAGVANPGSDDTPRLIAKHELMESERQAHRVFQSIGDAVIVTDANNTIKQMNPAAEAITGLAQGQGQGLPLSDVFRVIDRTTRKAIEVAGQKTGRTDDAGEPPQDRATHQAMLIAKDGGEIAIDHSAAPMHDAQGGEAGRVLVFRDVREKLEREQLVKGNEFRLQTFVDSIPALAWMANADGWIFWYNRRWYEYTGTTPKEMEGWGWQTVHDPLTLPSVMERWTDSIQTKTPFEMVFPLRGADGVLRPFLTRVVPLLDETGTVLQWFGTNTEIDELLRTRRALEESERLSRRVLQSIGDAVIVTDAETRIAQMNPVAEALTGWKFEEARGQSLSSVFRIVNESTRKVVESPAEKVQRTGMVVGLANHTVLLAKDDREIAIDDSAAPIRDEQGVLVGIVLVFRDIGERRREEREREQLDQRLQLALSAANGVGIWDWDVPRNRVFTDENFAAMYGVDPTQGKTGLSLAEFTANMHPDDVDRVGAEITRTLGTGEDFASEYRLLQRDGSVRWVFAKGRCSYDRDGRPLRFPGVTVDITERIATENALRSSEERLRVAMSTARLGSWTVDLVTSQMECDPLCKANYGRKQGENFKYADLLDCVHPDDRERMQMEVREAIANRAPYRCEYRVLWPDESLHWVVASGQISYDAKGKPLRIAGVSLDVTERHRTHAALMQTEKLAAVGRLAASIAHEINNPLESVTNLLYLARTSEDEAEIQNYLTVAERELRRVSVISNQTLRFYRQSTNAKAVTCEELFESVLSIYQGRLVNSRVTVEKRKRATHPVECFEGEIRQVLNNLVANAIDAMHPTGGKLLIRSRDAHSWTTGDAGVVLTVADNGTGMPPSVLKNLFEAFFTTKGIGGTGLGLWVSREIVDRHHGTLRVRSSQRARMSGTVFTVFLPYDAVSR